MDQSHATVIVIDDHHDVAEVLACVLARANFRPVIAHDGADGLHQARALQASVILCDSPMPALRGVEVIARLRSDPSTANIPVLLMSGSATDGGCAGEDAFVVKPFDFARLVDTVRTLVKKTAGRLAGSKCQSTRTECLASAPAESDLTWRFQNMSSHSQPPCSGVSARVPT